MAEQSDTPLDVLWREYGQVFREFDDLTLARWMAQTLGQLQGRVWRLSHPLVAAYRLAAQVGHDRGVWLKRLATIPAGYTEAECCRAPLLPLITRDSAEAGLICQHCQGTALAFADLPPEFQAAFRQWAAAYGPVHEVAHWDDAKRKKSGYQKQFDDAGYQAEELLADLASNLAPQLLDHHVAVVWEDHDECLDIRPEDIHL